MECQIKTPEIGIFIETIGETIDLNKDTPETIYDRLVKENPQMSMPQNGNSNKPQSKHIAYLFDAFWHFITSTLVCATRLHLVYPLLHLATGGNKDVSSQLQQNASSGQIGIDNLGSNISQNRIELGYLGYSDHSGYLDCLGCPDHSGHSDHSDQAGWW